MLPETTRDLLIIIGLPILVSLFVAAKALRHKSPKHAWLSSSARIWAYSTVLSIPVGFIIDSQYSGSVEIPATFVLPLFELIVGGCIAFVVGGVLALVVFLKTIPKNNAL
jgi:hypothetical protein